MDAWMKKRLKFIIYEVIVIIIICIFVTVGLYWQFKPGCKLGIISSSVNRDFAMVILQIQATLDALTIAIIALISGSISNSYMGVGFSDYYLNIRPLIFKQKLIIVCSLLFLGANISFFTIGWYYLVLWFLAITLVLILISVNEVYLIFNGKKLLENEIKDYINYILGKRSEYTKKYNICQSFINDWVDIIASQSKENYEVHKSIFIKGITALLSYKTQESLDAIKEICKRTEYVFLNSENNIVRENGIVLLEKIYDKLWEYILSNKETINYQAPFTLFDEVYRFTIDAIEMMPAEKVRKYVRWDNLIDSVQRVVFWIGYDEASSQIELGNTFHFARYAGYYLSEHYDEKYVSHWKWILEICFNLYSYNIPTNRVDDYLKAQCIVKFNYVYGFIENGLDVLVIENFFGGAMAKIFYLDDKYKMLLGMLVHCYLYYLALRESETVVVQKVRDCAKKVITNKDVKNIYALFLQKICRNSDFLNIETMEEMEKILNPYEKINNHSKGYLIIENVVREYYMFIVLYLANTYNMSSLIAKALDDDIYTSYVYENKSEETKQILFNLYRLMDYREDSDEVIKSKVELMYDEFANFEKQRFKEKQKQIALHNHVQYILNVNKDEVIQHIKENVMERIKEKFKDIIIDSDKNGEIIKIPVLNLFDYTDSINDHCVDSFYTNMYGQFSLGLEWILRRRNVLETVDRANDFLDDKDYMSYLQSGHWDLLLGSKYVLINKDYKLTREFENLTENWKKIYTMFMENGIALKSDSIRVCIHSIEVTIRPQNISDEKQKYNEETGLYTYSIYSGMPIDFTESDLEAFLHDNRKVVEISAKISVQTPNEKIGVLIMGERGELLG